MTTYARLPCVRRNFYWIQLIVFMNALWPGLDTKPWSNCKISYCSFENVIVAELRMEGGMETQIRRNVPRNKRNLAHGFR